MKTLVLSLQKYCLSPVALQSRSYRYSKERRPEDGRLAGAGLVQLQPDWLEQLRTGDPSSRWGTSSLTLILAATGVPAVWLWAGPGRSVRSRSGELHDPRVSLHRTDVHTGQSADSFIRCSHPTRGRVWGRASIAGGARDQSGPHHAENSHGP